MKLIYKIKYDNKQYIHQLQAHTTERLGENIVKEKYIRFLDSKADLNIEIIGLKDLKTDVIKYTAKIVNNSDRTVRVCQFDVGLLLPTEELTLNYFTSDWGSEFYPHKRKVENEFSYGSISGRSSKGFSPWAGLITPNQSYSVALAWSGSWNCTITPIEKQYGLTMGFSTEGFYTDVSPHEEFSSASIYIAKGTTLEDANLEMRRYFKSQLSLLNDYGIADVPIEYNEWWPYEDKYITEDIYHENAIIAKDLGCRYAMMDAGWFGENENGKTWYEKRGDWEIINKRDFPSGMKALCDKAKEIEILPGIWCEIEAVGKDAKLNDTHENIIAKRDGKSLGYVCFGSKEGRKWAMSVVDRILGQYGAKWIKFDFNLDPAPGCNVSGHEHGRGDGLNAHYIGYYKFLDKIHKKYPDVVIENCSSGGLRMDIEMMSHTHWGHLSDPDHTEFHLQCYWGALSYLHQSACLHFSWSEVLQNHNKGITNPIHEDMEKYRYDYIIRAVLMGIPGYSYKLPQMPKWCKERLKELNDFYINIYQDYILNGDVHRLTEQPIVGGKGERFPCFQFNNDKHEAVIFAFRLVEAKVEKKIYPRDLIGDKLYEVLYIDSGVKYQKFGKELEADGVTFENMPEESSEIVRINNVG